MRLKGTYELFQSTPPVKAATVNEMNFSEAYRFQSTPPVKAATALCKSVYVNISISIHAAREGGDVRFALLPQRLVNFNPRRP